MRERNRFFLLVAIMVVACVGVTAVSLWILYGTAMQEQRERLTESAQSQARLIEAVARFDKQYSKDFSKDTVRATLYQIRDAHGKYKGFGETGEFTLAERVGDKIVFLLSHRHFDLDNPRPVDFNSQLAEPMRLALSGKSGSVIGLDYRGQRVLAAYEPVREVGWGIVAKLDLSEIQAPFIRAAVIVFFMMVVVVLSGAVLFYVISAPVIKILENQNQDLLAVNRQLAEENRQRKEVEEALLKTAERLINAQHIAGMGDFTWDVETGEVTWSEAMYHLLGYDPSESIDYDLVNKDIHHPDDLPRITQWLNDSVASGEEELPPNEYRLIRKDGREIYVRVRGEIKREEGQSPKIFATLQDISEIHRAQTEVHRALRFLEFAIEQVPVPVIIADAPDVTITHFNRSAVELLLKVPQDVRKIRLEEQREFWPTFYPDGSPYTIEDLPLTRAIQKGEISRNVEIIVRSGDGERWISASAAPMKDDTGEVIAGIVVFPDITELKRAHEQISRLNRDLEQRVRARTRQLESANKELEAFAYSVSHDLKAPLRAINGFAEIIAGRHRNSLNEQGRHYFDNIVEAAEQMGELIEDLLKYSRLGRRAVKYEPVNLAETFAQIRTNFNEKIDQSAAKITLPDNFPVVRGDRSLLYVIFSNIFENALTYRQQDIAPEIDISWREEENGITIIIEDNGIGIASEYHDKIFDIFQRLHPQSSYPGTGIGLGLVKKAVDLSGGNIHLESRLGEGSAFFIVFPDSTEKT